MTLREFFVTLWRGKYEVIGAILVVVIGAVLYLDRQEATFAATAEVHLSTAETAIEGADLGEVTVPADAAQVQSPEVVAAVAEATGVPAAGLTGRLDASVEDEVVAITVEGTDAQEVEATARAFAEAYAAWLESFRDERVDYYSQRRAALTEDLTAIGPVTMTDGIADDPLADAERELIIAEYTSLTVELRTLRALPEPVAEPAQSVDVEELGPPWEATVGAAGLAGLLAGVGLAFARRGLDTRIRTSDQVGRRTEAPVIAELLAVRNSVRDFRRTQVLPVTRRAATPFTESIRQLRTAIEIAVAHEEHPVVVITAADDYGPRSFITANVAASFGLSGMRVVAVAGDLRRPELADLLPARSTSDPRDLRPVGAVPNTSILRLPESELDPADLLATPGVRDLIEQVRRDADLVIIDAPPVLAAADATILGRYATTSVLVAAARATHSDILTHSIEHLRTSSVDLAGVALAEVRVGRSMAYASTYGDDRAAPYEPPARDEGEPGPAEDVPGPAAAAPAALTPAAAGEERTPATPADPGNGRTPVSPAEPGEGRRRTDSSSRSFPVPPAEDGAGQRRRGRAGDAALGAEPERTRSAPPPIAAVRARTARPGTGRRGLPTYG